MKNPHPPFVSLVGRVWEDCNKILLATISQLIDLNVIGWEVVTCLQCGRQEQDCGLDCPVGLAIALRDKISGP